MLDLQVRLSLWSSIHLTRHSYVLLGQDIGKRFGGCRQILVSWNYHWSKSAYSTAVLLVRFRFTSTRLSPMSQVPLSTAVVLAAVARLPSGSCAIMHI